MRWRAPEPATALSPESPSLPPKPRHPAVPADLPTGACVVRVVAGRPFNINIGLANWDKVNVSTAVARYERFEDDTTSGCI